MSNSLAIAAVTATLGQLLRRATPNVTAIPLSLARTGQAGDQLNLCLYHLGIDAHLRNLPPPPYPGTTGSAGNLLLPLPLQLSYLVTAFVDDAPNSEIDGQILLGEAMRVLHDHPVLDSAEIRLAAQGFSKLRPSNLHQQVERIRVTQMPLSNEDISRLWTAFQTGYRLSVAYLVSVVFIDSARQGGSALPVLRRGADDRGPVAESFDGGPLLERIEMPQRQSSAFIGDTITLFGKNLGAASFLRLTNFARDRQADVALDAGSGNEEARCTITPAAAPRAGIYTLAAVREQELSGDRHVLFSNTLPFTVAPRISKVAPFGASIPPPAPGPVAVAKRDATGKVRLAVTFAPPVEFTSGKEFGQRVRLLFGGREIGPETTQLDATGAETPLTAGDHGTLLFVIVKVADAERRTHVLRLRVDGVDAVAAELKDDPLHPERGKQLEFADAQKVEVVA